MVFNTWGTHFNDKSPFRIALKSEGPISIHEHAVIWLPDPGTWRGRISLNKNYNNGYNSWTPCFRGILFTPHTEELSFPFCGWENWIERSDTLTRNGDLSPGSQNREHSVLTKWRHWRALSTGPALSHWLRIINMEGLGVLNTKKTRHVIEKPALRCMKWQTSPLFPSPFFSGSFPCNHHHTPSRPQSPIWAVFPRHWFLTFRGSHWDPTLPPCI